MAGKICTLVFFIILIFFGYMAFKDSNIGESVKKMFKKPSPPQKLAVGPTVYVRNDKEKEYKKYEVRNPVFTIGRGLRCDLHIDEPYIAGRQAEIRQRREKGDVFFTLTNLAKTNITEYLNQEKMKYQWMDYKDEVELGEKEAFYFGNTKLLVITPKLGHPVAKSDREMVKKSDIVQKERKSTDRLYNEDWYDVKTKTQEM